MRNSEFDHFVFYGHILQGQYMYLVVYADDIVIVKEMFVE